MFQRISNWLIDKLFVNNTDIINHQERIMFLISKCENSMQLSRCIDAINRFKKKNSRVDGIFELEYQMRLAIFERSNEISFEKIEKEKEKYAVNKMVFKTTVVTFLKNPANNEVFVYFPEFETEFPRVTRLCYYKGEYCELSFEFIERCVEAYYHEYKHFREILAQYYDYVKIKSSTLSMN